MRTQLYANLHMEHIDKIKVNLTIANIIKYAYVNTQ